MELLAGITIGVVATKAISLLKENIGYNTGAPTSGTQSTQVSKIPVPPTLPTKKILLKQLPSVPNETKVSISLREEIILAKNKLKPTVIEKKSYNVDYAHPVHKEILNRRKYYE